MLSPGCSPAGVSPEDQVTVATPDVDSRAFPAGSLATTDPFELGSFSLACGLGQPPGETLRTRWASACWLTKSPLIGYSLQVSCLLGHSQGLLCASLWPPLWPWDFERPALFPDLRAHRLFIKSFFIIVFSSPLSLVQISRCWSFTRALPAIQGDCGRYSWAPAFSCKHGTSPRRLHWAQQKLDTISSLPWAPSSLPMPH